MSSPFAGVYVCVFFFLPEMVSASVSMRLVCLFVWGMPVVAVAVVAVDIPDTGVVEKGELKVWNGCCLSPLASQLLQFPLTRFPLLADFSASLSREPHQRILDVLVRTCSACERTTNKYISELDRYSCRSSR